MFRAEIGCIDTTAEATDTTWSCRTVIQGYITVNKTKQNKKGYITAKAPRKKTEEKIEY